MGNSPEFTDLFIDKVANLLDTVCSDESPSITQAALCEKLGLDAYWKSTVGGIIKANLIEGYELRGGNGGGIRKVGVSSPRNVNDLTTVAVSDGFLKDLRQTLYTNCLTDRYISREIILNRMPKKYPNARMLISAAMKQGLLPEYESKRGHGGGLKKK